LKPEARKYVTIHSDNTLLQNPTRQWPDPRSHHPSPPPHRERHSAYYNRVSPNPPQRSLRVQLRSIPPWPPDPPPPPFILLAKDTSAQQYHLPATQHANQIPWLPFLWGPGKQPASCINCGRYGPTWNLCQGCNDPW
jgi:hypothetical protein